MSPLVPESAPRRRAALFPARVRLAFLIVAAQVLIGAVFRVTFFYLFRARAGELADGSLSQAFYLGTKFDLRLGLLLVLPLLVLGFVPFLDPARNRLARRVWLVLYVVLQAVVFSTYAADLGHYEYLHQRLHPAVLNELQEPAIAGRMVWDSYPVIPGFVALVLLIVGYAFYLRRFGRSALAAERTPARTGARVAAGVALGLAVACGIYGKLSWYPLRWSDAYFGTERFVSAVALNPVLFFFDSLKTASATFDEDAARAHYDEVARLLEVDRPHPETLSFARWQEPLERPTKPRNLVVIHLESWAGFKTGCMGNALPSSPHFDALAERSILFTNFHVAIGPTARSVFTMLSGIPDFSPVSSASRNPLLVVQHSAVEALDGYARLYFLGGSASWANIRGMLNGSITDLEMWEEGDYPGIERPDTWGISDLHLFEAANEVLAAQERPFFAFIQTAGNHKPYSLPDDDRGFEPEPRDEAELFANGFSSQEAYDGFRFLDHALGRFFELAAQSPYYQDTIFLMYGDHGLPATNDIPYERLGLTGSHVPFLVHAPGWISEPDRIDSVASLCDLLTTAMSQIGVPFLNTGFGRDLLRPRAPEDQFAYVQDGLLTNDFLLRVDPGGGSLLYGYRSDAPTEERSAELPDEAARLRRMHDGLYECGRYLLFHNAPRPHVGH